MNDQEKNEIRERFNKKYDFSESATLEYNNLVGIADFIIAEIDKLMEGKREEVEKKIAEYEDSAKYMEEKGFKDIALCEKKVVVMLKWCLALFTNEKGKDK